MPVLASQNESRLADFYAKFVSIMLHAVHNVTPIDSMRVTGGQQSCNDKSKKYTEWDDSPMMCELPACLPITRQTIWRNRSKTDLPDKKTVMEKIYSLFGWSQESPQTTVSGGDTRFIFGVFRRSLCAATRFKITMMMRNRQA